MFFVPKALLDCLIESGRYGNKVAVEAIREGHKVALSAIATENAFLRAEVASLKHDLAIETARSQALVDRLLVRDAKIYPVQPIATEAVKAAQAEKDKIGKEISKVFDQMSSVGEDAPEVAQSSQQVDFDGGGRVVQ